MKTLVCSCFTPQYEDKALGLAQSLAKLGLDYKLYPYSGTFSYVGWVAWMVNCHGSMDMLLHALEDNADRPVLFVDADSTFEQWPKLIEEFEANEEIDAAFYWMPDNGMLANGTIWLRNDQKCRDFVREYTSLCNQTLTKWLDTNPSTTRRPDRSVWEQTVLQRHFNYLTKKHGIRWVKFPDAYCLVYDRQAQDHSDPVIQHWQASRDKGSAVHKAPLRWAARTEVMLEVLPRPLLLVGNAGEGEGGGGRGAPPLPPGFGSYVRFNNWKSGRCDLWLTSCWVDVQVREVSVPTATIYQREDTLYSAKIADWNKRFQEVNGKGIGTAEKPWRSLTERWCKRFNIRRPTSGLMLSFALSDLQVPFTVHRFTGRSRGHEDERKAFKSLGVHLDILE